MNRLLIFLFMFLGPLAIFLIGVGTWKGVYYICHNMVGWDKPGAFMATILILAGMFGGLVMSPMVICAAEDKG